MTKANFRGFFEWILRMAPLLIPHRIRMKRSYSSMLLYLVWWSCIELTNTKCFSNSSSASTASRLPILRRCNVYDARLQITNLLEASTSSLALKRLEVKEFKWIHSIRSDMVGKVFKVKCNARRRSRTEMTKRSLLKLSLWTRLTVYTRRRERERESKVKRCRNRIREKLICSIVFSLAVKNHLKISCFRQFFPRFSSCWRSFFFFWSAKQFPFGNGAHFAGLACDFVCDSVSLWFGEYKYLVSHCWLVGAFIPF